MKLSDLKLSHLRQLHAYIQKRDYSGWYYGPKGQFERRHEHLLAWIEAAITEMESSKNDKKNDEKYHGKVFRQYV